jgi:hypothetical protein
MAPRAERVGIFFARTLEESAATRLAKLDHFSDFLSQNIRVGAPRRSDDESSRPIPKWKLFWQNGNFFGPFERELDCARGGLKIKKRSYNSVDEFHRGIRGDSYENDSFSGLNASVSTVKPPTDGFRSARARACSRRSPVFLRRNVANARKEGFACFGDKAR